MLFTYEGLPGFLPVPSKLRQHYKFLSSLNEDTYVTNVEGGGVFSEEFPAYIITECSAYFERRVSEEGITRPPFEYRLNRTGFYYRQQIETGAICNPAEWLNNASLLEKYLAAGGNEALAIPHIVKSNKPILLHKLHDMTNPVAVAMLDAKRIGGGAMDIDAPLDDFRMRGGQISAYARLALEGIADRATQADLQKSTHSKVGGVSNALEYAIVLTYSLMQAGLILRENDND